VQSDCHVKRRGETWPRATKPRQRKFNYNHMSVVKHAYDVPWLLGGRASIYVPRDNMHSAMCYCILSDACS
jgi:hypothetical protein